MKKLVLLSTIVLGLATASCDSYLDINTSPNSPSAANITPSNEMPGAEMDLAASYGDYYRICGGYYSQHFSQSFGTSNYLDYSQFSQSATRSSGSFVQLNQGAIKTFTDIQKQATASEDWGSNLAATVLKAFTYQALVDAYGTVPYSEAMDPSNTAPKYDEGADVYAGLVAEIDDALSKVSPSSPVCTNFLYSGQNAAPWIKFANAEKLRLLSRESGAVDVASQIKAIIDGGNLPNEDIAYKDIWSTESGQESPYYAEEYATNFGSTQVNVVANIAVVGTMQTEDYTDPRLAAWVEKNNKGKYVGGVSGTNFSVSSSYKAAYWCRPKASYDMPVYLISLSDINFYIAEYYARKGDAANAKKYYDEAVKASFATAGVDGADEYLKQNPYKQDNWKKSIGVAKWIADFGTDDFEAYCSIRHLGYPTFEGVSGDDIYDDQTDASYKPEKYVPGTLYTPIKAFTKVGAKKLLERWPIPVSSSTRNANAPKFTDADYTKPIFWATK